jgi:hypothetical protein
MRRPCSILILCVLLGFGVSLAVQAEDVPETAFDESEGLPYEDTPLFSIVGSQASARLAKAKAELSCEQDIEKNSVEAGTTRDVPSSLVHESRLPIEYFQ